MLFRFVSYNQDEPDELGARVCERGSIAELAVAREDGVRGRHRALRSIASFSGGVHEALKAKVASNG